MRFALAPCPPDYADHARHRFDFEVDLQAPPERVFAMLADAEAWPRWFPDVKSMTWATPPGPDAVRHVVTSTGRIEERYVAWDPPRRMTFYVSRMALPLVRRFVEDYELEPLGAGTRLRWRVAYEPLAITRPLHPVLRPVFRRMFTKGIANLPAFAASYAAAAPRAAG